PDGRDDRERRQGPRPRPRPAGGPPTAGPGRVRGPLGELLRGGRRARPRQVPVRGPRGGSEPVDGPRHASTVSVHWTERLGEPDGRDRPDPADDGGPERVPERERSSRTDRPMREPGADARSVFPPIGIPRAGSAAVTLGGRIGSAAA